MTKAQTFEQYMKSLELDFIGTPMNDEMRNKHHRQKKEWGGTDKTAGGRKNIIVVNAKKHFAWTLLFDRMTPQQIADEINNVWLNPDYMFRVVHLQNLNHEKKGG